jgi:lambda family phage portal protein
MKSIQISKNNITASGQRVLEGQVLSVGTQIPLRDATFLVNSRQAKEVVIQKRPQQRAYKAAANKDILADFKPSQTSANEEIYPALSILRNRARELLRDDPYAVEYINKSVTNIVGEHGILLQGKVPNRSRTGRSKDPLDKRVNALIEEKHTEWGDRDTASVCGAYSWRGIQEATVRAESGDGELFIRMIDNFPNKHRFSLQVIESDFCDHELNTKLTNGNSVVMGIEIDQWRRPVRYWFHTNHPGDTFFIRFNGKKYVSFPAEDILHIFKTLRPGQLRGVTHFAPVMITSKMLNAYQEAELVAARMEAAQPFWIEQETPEGWKEDDQLSDGSLINEIQAGITNILAPGQHIKSPELTRPGTMYPSFIKANLRATATGLGVAYNGLANDLEGVNFSSMRSGLLQERDNWKVRQQFLIERLCKPVYKRWLKMALRTELQMLSASRFDDYLKVKFQPRGFPWVDPSKDVQAAVLAYENNMTTLTDILAEKGTSLDHVITTKAAEVAKIEAAGLTVKEVISGGSQEENGDG